MANPKWETLERLQGMRDALPTVSFMHGPHPYTLLDLEIEKTREGRDFLFAAHEALGPTGCVTRELAQLRDQLAGKAELEERYEALLKMAQDGSRNELEEFLFNLEHPPGYEEDWP